jgi:hypothetical protein
MTISIRVSVNGNYQCPVTYKQGDREVTEIVSGYGRDTPGEIYIPFYHGPDLMNITVGPERPDNGESKA